MKKSVFLTVFLGLLLVSTAAALQPGDTLWTRFYGGDAPDFGHSVQQTTDGGFIVAGYTRSFGNGSQLYLVKTDANGDTLWTLIHGRSDNEIGNCVQQTADGGYIVVGEIWITHTSDWDVYAVKTDADGQPVWTQTYGGDNWDHGWSVQEATEGGYIIAGRTMSYGAGSNDVYLIKIDERGRELWSCTFGGADSDGAKSVQLTSDGGYIITGYTHSFGAGLGDVYLVKTDADGNLLWTRTYGGSDQDGGYGVQQTSDGGYIIAGRTQSFGAGGYDAYLIKTNANGDPLWTRTYGGTRWDFANSVDETTDGGYILGGNTDSFGAGGFDVYLVRTDSYGDTLWTRAYGYSSDDYAMSVQQTTDGGYIAAGYWTDVGPNYNDVYLLRIAGEQAEPEVSIELLPDDPPVTVPPGGSFGFTGTLTNNTEDPQITDIWVMASGPEKGIYGPFKEFYDIPLAASQSRSRHLNQRVANLAPLGFYDYIAYCGDYPATVVDSSFFQIEVVAGPAGGCAGWVLTGSFLEGDPADVPFEFALSGNYPNPFNASTVISYELPSSGQVTLEVFNIAGQRVATLVDGQQEAGYRSVTWEASEVSSGLYFYKLTAGDFTETRRMTLVK